MTENTPLIIPELVSLDADAGPGKEDVIEFLAATVAGASRASSRSLTWTFRATTPSPGALRPRSATPWPFSKAASPRATRALTR